MVDRSDLVPLKLDDYDFVLAIQIFIIDKVYENGYIDESPPEVGAIRAFDILET